MANIINGTDTGSGGLITTGDSSDELQLQTAETTAITITSGQQSAFIAGTASAPAVTTTGDLNTGIYFPAADTLGLVTGGTEAARVDSSRNFLVGTTDTSPAGNNVVGVALSPSLGRIQASRDGGVPAFFNRKTSDGDIAVFNKDGTTVGAIGTTSGELYINFGGSTGGAVTSRTLDDYEEGTWTPTTNGDATGSFSAQAGTYTKIGNQVTVHGQFVVLTNFTSNLIGGLPFVPKVANPSISGVYSIGVVRNDAGNRYIQIVNSATTVTFQSTMTGTASNLTTSDGVIRFAMTYQTT